MLSAINPWRLPIPSLSVYWHQGDFPTFTDLKQALQQDNKPNVAPVQKPALAAETGLKWGSDFKPT